MLKIESAKIKSSYLRLSIARIRLRFKKIRHISINGLNYLVKKLEGGLFFFSVSYLACSQIWLNLSMDDRHLSYITKLTPKIIQNKTKQNYSNFTHSRESPLRVPRVCSLKLLLIVTSAGPVARPRRHKRHEVVRAPSRRTALQPGFLGRKAARGRRSRAHYGMLLLPLRCAAGTHAQTDDNLRILCCCTQRERERERILRE
jgi:hypothetical protein